MMKNTLDDYHKAKQELRQLELMLSRARVDHRKATLRLRIKEQKRAIKDLKNSYYDQAKKNQLNLF